MKGRLPVFFTCFILRTAENGIPGKGRVAGAIDGPATRPFLHHGRWHALGKIDKIGIIQKTGKKQLTPALHEFLIHQLL
jgi:hypothetical protein